MRVCAAAAPATAAPASGRRGRPAGGVAGVAVVADQLARLDRHAGVDAGGVGGEVGVVVLVPVDALDVEAGAAQRAVGEARDLPVDHGVELVAVGVHDVDALVRAPAGT